MMHAFSARRHVVNSVAMLAVACVLAACGAGDFQKPVQQFAQGVGDTREALKSLSAEMGERARARMDAKIGDPGTFIGARSGECLVEGNQRCRIEVGGETYPPETRIRDILEIFDLLGRYADSLNTIVTRKTAEAVTASAGETLGHVAVIAEKAGLGGSLDDATVQGNVKNALGFLAGEYVDYVKVSALKDATGKAQEPIRAIGDLFRRANVFLGDIGRAEQVRRFDQKMNDLQDARESGDVAKARRLLAEAGELAEAIDRSTDHTPAAVVAAMVASHDALVEALRRDEPSLANLHAQMQRFVAKGEELKSLVEAFLK